MAASTSSLPKGARAREAARANPRKTVVWFQGGGPLGAFGCGAWKALWPLMRASGAEVVAVGGASMGAVNAAIVRAHLASPGGGAAVLESVWRDDIAAPSWPFFGWPWQGEAGDHARHWNALVTGLVAGNGLYRPQPSAWSAWGMANRVERPLFDRRRMWRLLETHVQPYRSQHPAQPLLAVASTGVADGRLHLHDSDSTPITPTHVAASSALPGMFDPVEIDGQLQWDGELVPMSPLPALMERVMASGRVAAGEPVRVVTIEQLPSAAPGQVRSSPEVIYRAINLAQVDKLAGSLDGPVSRLRIIRPALPLDGISGLLDHSPERIATLIGLGEEAAASAWQAGATAPARRRALTSPGGSADAAVAT